MDAIAPPPVAVPIVNAEALFAPAPSAALAAGRADTDRVVGESLREHGCVVLHGLPSAARLPRSRAATLCSYFSLPVEQKSQQQVAVQRPGNSNVFWGYYTRHQGPPESRWLYNEHIQVGPPREVPHRGSWSETDESFVPSSDGSGDPHFAANPWPDESVLPGWRDEMEHYFLAMEDVGDAILRAMVRHFGATNLGVADDDDAAARWSGGVSTLRPMRYPALPTGVDPSQLGEGFSMSETGRLITAGEHCDNGTGISLLWQECAGLQVRSPSTDAWIDVPHSAAHLDEDDSLLSVHVGRGLQIMTGHRLQATRHRVLSTGASRDSIGFFFCPHPAAVLPLEAKNKLYDPLDEASWPWAKFSSNSTAPYKPGKGARVDTSPQKSLSDPANLGHDAGQQCEAKM